MNRERSSELFEVAKKYMPGGVNSPVRAFKSVIGDPIFIAHGPSFKKNVTVPHFTNVNVYSLLCHLLGVTPAPNDGTLSATSDMLRRDETLALTGITCMLTWCYLT